MSGERDIRRVEQLLVGTALLEFWHVYKAGEITPYLVAADNYWAEKIELEKGDVSVDSTAVQQEVDIDENQIEQNDTSLEDLLNDNELDSEDALAGVDEEQYDANPILSRILAPGNNAGPIIATFRASDQELIQGYLNDQQARTELNPALRNVKFVWGRPELNDELGYELIDLYAIRSNAQGEAPLSGGVITDARQDFDINGQPIVSMSMNSEGAKIWEEMTTEAFQNQTQVAVVLDNTVYSAPGINDGPIAGGNSQISGDFTVAEAEDLATVLKAGKLPARAEIIQKEIIGPSLGQEAINSGLWSFAIALSLVLVWMFFYYGRAGLYADVALLVNILFIFGALASFGAVLTLPGIAGIVLTIGISVDANVLIFERIKEELAKGKSQADSIKDGFNNALSSILDANITTFLTAAILYIFGTGPIQGFATTLMIGILTSLFTAIFITRLFIDGYGKNGKSLAFSTSITKTWFTNNATSAYSPALP